MKKLPAGQSSFEIIRQGDWLYVDKTEIIYRLIQQGQFFFLSRPRRFGKSLTVPTLKAIFEGRKDLFEGLWICDKMDWEQQHPVILLSFNGIDYKNHGLEKALSIALDNVAAGFELQLTGESSKDKFNELIVRLGQKAKVVILVDEYDKPINDFLHDYQQADENRDILRNLFGVMKDASLVDNLRFVFLTGVSKFSKVSMISEMNNLTDLTHHPRVSKLVGITQEELERDFASHIEALSQETGTSKEDLLAKIKHWYNGYSWDGKTFLYNPFSLLHLFQSGEFSNYWFQSGTTSWLVRKIKESKLDLPSLENKLVEATFFEEEIRNLDHVALLYQTGYLTIKSVEAEDDEEWFALGYPNQEVRNSLLKNLYVESA